ncbi:MAG: hypothetical protein WC007_12440 [Pelobacteraceae bacterium]
MTILKADTETRRKSLYIIGIMTIFGIVIIEFGLPRLKAYLHNLPPKDALQVLNIVLSLCFLSLIPWAIYFYRLGHKIIDSNLFPPPGIKVVRDTKILTGLAARRRGFFLVVGGLVLTVMALFGSVYFPIMLNKLVNNPMNDKPSNEGIHRTPQSTLSR